MARILLSLATVLSLVGCDADDARLPTLPESAGDELLSTVSTNYDLQEIEKRYVVIQSPTARCAASVGGWNRAPLFPGATAQQLKRFCVWSWGAGGAPNLSVLPSTYPAVAAPDRFAISGLGRSKTYLDDLEDATLDQIDPIASYSSPMVLQSRLAVLDTLQTSDAPLTADYFDDHGHKVAAVADASVCDGGTPRSCAAGVTSGLTIAWEQTGSASSLSFSRPKDAGQDLGGTVGRQTDLATAIVATVDDWIADSTPTGSTVGNLVINLSLGWAPGGDGDLSRSASEEAVHAALEYASCKGALVLAAAGHDDTPVGGLGATGAVYPAAWEAEAEPTNAECNLKYGGYSRSVPSTAYRPLVHAVGAVSTDREPLAMSRPGSAPRLAAPGAHLTITPSATGTTNEPFSGTSASTAVASSAAAVAWSFRPLRNGHDIMNAVYVSGFSTGHSSDVWMSGTSSSTVRVANVCRALARVCLGRTCGLTYTPSSCDGTAVDTAEVWDGDTTSVHSMTGTTYGSATCATGHTYHYYDSNYYSAGPNCPIQEDDSAVSVAVIRPMPPTTFCPTCPAFFPPGGGPGHVDLHLTEPITYVDNPTITVHFATHTGEPDHYPLASLPGYLPGAAPTQLTLEMPAGAGERFDGSTHYATGVTLDYMLDGFSYSETLHLEQ